MARRLVAAALVSAVAACSIYKSDSPSSSAEPAKVTNLLDNADFALGCAGWVATGDSASQTVTLNSEPSGHGGPPSCRVCWLPPYNGAFGIEQVVTHGVAAGEKYYGEAWIHDVAGQHVPASLDVKVTVRADAADAGGEELSVASTPGVAAEWREATVLFTAPSGGNAVGLVLRASTSNDQPQPCFLVDDAIVRPAE